MDQYRVGVIVASPKHSLNARQADALQRLAPEERTRYAAWIKKPAA